MICDESRDLLRSPYPTYQRCVVIWSDSHITEFDKTHQNEMLFTYLTSKLVRKDTVKRLRKITTRIISP